MIISDVKRTAVTCCFFLCVFWGVAKNLYQFLTPVKTWHQILIQVKISVIISDVKRTAVSCCFLWGFFCGFFFFGGGCKEFVPIPYTCEETDPIPNTSEEFSDNF